MEGRRGEREGKDSGRRERLGLGFRRGGRSGRRGGEWRRGGGGGRRRRRWSGTAGARGRWIGGPAGEASDRAGVSSVTLLSSFLVFLFTYIYLDYVSGLCFGLIDLWAFFLGLFYGFCSGNLVIIFN